MESSKVVRNKSKTTQPQLKKQPSDSPEDPFFDAKRQKPSDSLKPPKAESAPNKFLARLFEAPQTN